MYDSVMDTLTEMSELDDKHNFTVARVVENGKCVELHYNNGKPILEYGEKGDDNTWYNEIDNKVDWFNLDLTDEDVLKILNEKFIDYFGEYTTKEFEFYSEEEIEKIINLKTELYYVDDGIDEAIIKIEDIPDFIVDYNRNLEIRDLKFYKVGKDVYEPDITTRGEFIDRINPKLREKIIDRLILLQTNEVQIKKYKIIDENLFSIVENRIEEKIKKDRRKKNREVR